ncbi:hypothetical protein WI94_19355 [Burkholderia vietnamiensis]|nr:hypothetical protein [Burkholderia vietnamiensis]KVE52968.1 hypothetical protein WI94_19355 [Burkholderia vietnamiensis]KVE81969.1 hypothetical protein WJ00_26645 [Burkholderia vietnamiensis]MDN7924687.1 hypothetical protein [Burkholderia vietnamiensis]
MEYRISYEHSLASAPDDYIVHVPSQLVDDVPANIPRALLPEYIADLIFPDGTQVKDIDTDDDVHRAKELFGDRFAAAVPAPPSFDLPAFSPSVAAAIAAPETKRKAKPFADVAHEALQEEETALDAIAAKQRAFADVEKRIGSPPIASYLIDDAVAYKDPYSAHMGLPVFKDFYPRSFAS